MVVWVLIRGHIAMVLVVLGKELPVKVVGKQQRRDPSGHMVCFFIARNNAVHRIVCGNKKTGV